MAGEAATWIPGPEEWPATSARHPGGMLTAEAREAPTVPFTMDESIE